MILVTINEANAQMDVNAVSNRNILEQMFFIRITKRAKDMVRMRLKSATF